MVRSLNFLKGKAKLSIETIEMSVLFYTTTLKLLKRNFGNPLTMDMSFIDIGTHY